MWLTSRDILRLFVRQLLQVFLTFAVPAAVTYGLIQVDHFLAGLVLGVMFLPWANSLHRHFWHAGC